MALSIWLHLFVLGLFMHGHFSNIQCAGSPERCWSIFSVTQLTPEIYWPCFEDKCRCSSTILDCSFGNISHVPWIASLRDTKLLNISNNNLTEISDPRFFSSVKLRSVRVLDLYNNRMTQCVSGVFLPLHKLERVFMGGNELTYNQIATTLYVPFLRSLELKCGGLGDIPQNFFHNRSCPRLRYIDMSWNTVKMLDMGVFRPLERLETLLLRFNNIETIRPSYHPSLKVWVVHNNELFSFPATCTEKGAPLYPNLTILNLDFNYVDQLPDPVCLPSLTTLSLKYNIFRWFFSNMFSLQRFPMLQSLGLTQMTVKISKMEDSTFNNSKLTEIEFALNNVDFSSVSTVDKGVFQGCPNLAKINLDQTHFAGVTTERFQSLFEAQISLKVLFLGKTGLKLRHDMFRNLSTVEELYLYGNSLRSIPDGVFDGLSNLTVLKLSNNQITTVPTSAFSDHLRRRLVKIDLSGNPFLCDCDIRPLQEWMESHTQAFEDYNNQGYLCQNVVNTTVPEFGIPIQACLLDQSTSIPISTTIVIFIVVLLFTMCKFKYRWHLRPLLYNLFRRHDRLEPDHYDFEYDVYVAADESDSGWVRDNLLPVLEEDWGLRVCFPCRNFHPGRSELESIGVYVSKSYTVVAIFSSDFANNGFRQRELDICQAACYPDHQPIVVPVLLPGLRPEELTGNMRIAMSAANYLKWSDNPEAIRSFRHCLRLALNVAM